MWESKKRLDGSTPLLGLDIGANKRGVSNGQSAAAGNAATDVIGTQPAPPRPVQWLQECQKAFWGKSLTRARTLNRPDGGEMNHDVSL